MRRPRHIEGKLGETGLHTNITIHELTKVLFVAASPLDQLL